MLDNKGLETCFEYHRNETTVELLETEGWGLEVKIKHYFNGFNVEATVRPAAHFGTVPSINRQ